MLNTKVLFSAVPICVTAILAMDPMTISVTQQKTADWLSRRTHQLDTRKTSEKRDTLFLAHKGIPDFVQPFNADGVTFRRYFNRVETLQAFLANPILIAGSGPYKRLPLDPMTRRFQSDTYDDLLGIFLTLPNKSAHVVGMHSEHWVDLRLPNGVGMVVVPSDDFAMTTFIIPADKGFELPVSEILDTSLKQ